MRSMPGGKWVSHRLLQHSRPLCPCFKAHAAKSLCAAGVDGYEMDGRQWKVDYADKRDFEDLGWKWTEGGGSISP